MACWQPHFSLPALALSQDRSLKTVQPSRLSPSLVPGCQCTTRMTPRGAAKVLPEEAGHSRPGSRPLRSVSLTCPPLPLGLTACSPVTQCPSQHCQGWFLTLAMPSFPHSLPPAALVLCQLLPSASCCPPLQSSRPAQSPTRLRAATPLRLPPQAPRSCLSLGFSLRRQDNCAMGSLAGANEE